MGHNFLIENRNAELRGRMKGARVSERVARSMKNQKNKCPEEEPHLKGQTWVLPCERGDTDECRSTCAQQGDSSRPKQWSLIACRLLLPWLCQWSMIPGFFPCRFFLHVQGSSSRPFKKETPGASLWFHCEPNSCLGGLPPDGAEQLSPQAGIQDLAQQKATALSPKIL